MSGPIDALRCLARRHLVFLLVTVALVGAGQYLVRLTSQASLRDAELLELCAELRVQVSRLSEVAALAELAETKEERRTLENSFRGLVETLRSNHALLFASLQASHLAGLTNARRFENSQDLAVYNLQKLTGRRVDPTWRRQASAETAQRYRASLASLQVLLTRSARTNAENVRLVGLIVLTMLVLAVLVQILAVSGPAVSRLQSALAALEAGHRGAPGQVPMVIDAR